MENETIDTLNTVRSNEAIAKELAKFGIEITVIAAVVPVVTVLAVGGFCVLKNKFKARRKAKLSVVKTEED